MPKYAETTTVSSESSRAEIERTLRRYGATAFAYGWQEGQAQVMFEMTGLIVFRLPMPSMDEFKFTPERQLERNKAAQEAAYEQAVRQRWRALALVIKAKLEAVDAHISTVEQEFLAHIALPDGRTVHEWLGPQLALAYAKQAMPALLPGSTDA